MNVEDQLYYQHEQISKCGVVWEIVKLFSFLIYLIMLNFLPFHFSPKNHTHPQKHLKFQRWRRAWEIVFVYF